MLLKRDTYCPMSQYIGAYGRKSFRDIDFGSKTFKNPEYEANRLTSDVALFAHTPFFTYQIRDPSFRDYAICHPRYHHANIERCDGLLQIPAAESRRRAPVFGGPIYFSLPRGAYREYRAVCKGRLMAARG